MPTPRARYWIATLSARNNVYSPVLVDGIDYIKGQLERGDSGYLHWQFVVYTARRITVAQLKRLLPRDVHVEPTRSRAAVDYVWKDDTCADMESRFELGSMPMRRNSPNDWAAIRSNAISDSLESIPDDVFVRYYGNLRRIAADNAGLVWRHDISVSLYWGDPGTGKTRRAFEEAGDSFYVKCGANKWWDGYKGETNVIIDDFSGLIRSDYLKTWLDRYPCRIEFKGGSAPLKATRFWITSNHSIESWYDNTVDQQAIKRRISTVIHFSASNPWTAVGTA